MSQPLHAHRSRLLVWVLSCTCVLIMLAGCGIRATAAGSTAATVTSTAQPATTTAFVRLHAVRTSAFPPNKVAAFDVTTADAARIAQLYQTIVTLTPYPPGAINAMFCPLDLGLLYHLTFTRADGSQVAGLIKPDGCEWAGVTDGATGNTPQGQITDGFWPQFAATFGVPMSALDYVTQSPSGPYAPVNVP